MTFAIRRSLAARDDLTAIWVSIARHDEHAAIRQLERIEQGIRQLADYPEAGPARDDLIDGIRVILRRPYLVLYRVDHAQSVVDIIRVIDARRDLEALFHE
ncbi:MAG: type II toxin-antitoxin system RelE/ParE family toxin [Sphingomonadales bacterium]|nr:type II toxin-antitoxin system RelE/ParE family toxin [Sphingomonadales bacterium]